MNTMSTASLALRAAAGVRDKPMMVTTARRVVLALAATLSIALLPSPVRAASSYVSGHVVDVTFASDWVMIRLDAGLPDNCVGSSYGWMKIPPENKPMNALAIGLWMRGDEANVVVTVYTDGLVGGYCHITQIDPQG